MRLRQLVATAIDARATAAGSVEEEERITEPLLFADQAFMKPPKLGSPKPYHQDNFYFECSPVDDVITCWVALDDATEENGCLRYIRASHRDGLLKHAPVPGDPNQSNLVPSMDDVDLSREVPAPVRKGGVILHHGLTLHASRENRSERWRRSYATHWASQRATTTSATTFEAPLFETAEWRQGWG